MGPGEGGIQFDFVDDGGQAIKLRLEIVLETVVLCQVDQFAQIGQGMIEVVPLLSSRTQFADPPHDPLCVFGVIPEPINSALNFEVCEFALVVGEVKVAPRADQPVRAMPRPLFLAVQTQALPSSFNICNYTRATVGAWPNDDRSPMFVVLRNRALSGFMMGHFTNDLFMGVLTALLPILKSEYDLSNAEIGLIALVQSGTGSILQPFFGILADKIRIRWFVPAIIIWDSIFVSLFGFTRDEQQLLLCAAMLGVGSAAFHPYGASGAAHTAEDGNMNSSLSLYTVAGTSGWAIGPLIATALIALFGKHGTIGFLGIGVVGSILIASRMVVPVVAAHESRAGRSVDSDDVQWGRLTAIIGIVMLRSWTFLALLSLLPIHYKELGYRLGFYNSIPTIMILAGAIGTLIGGRLADQIPGRRIIITSQLLSIIPAVLAAQAESAWVLPAAMIFGLFSDSSLSITLLAAQRLLPGRTGLASGVILGLGFVSGSLGVPITGALADKTSIPTALTISVVLAVGAALLSAALPGALFDLARRDSRTARAAPSEAPA
jgi:MFS transporter, FSR family, fosmidomycin resistance protein